MVILPLVVFAWMVLMVQLIILSRFFLAFRPRPENVIQDVPPVSVVVCAHDEESNIRTLVPMLLRQDYPEFEVIVVDDRSNDGTYDYLLESTRLHPKLKMVRVRFLPEHITGKKYALTLGVKAASFEWVLLTDADCRPVGDQWIRSMASGMTANRKIVLGYSPYEREAGYLNTFIRFESLVTAIQYIGSALLGTPYMGTGRNLAYRKSLFLDNKGFHGHLSVTGGDDDLFVNRHADRTNTSVCVGPKSLMRSLPKKTWKTFLLQKLRHLSVGKRYRWRDQWLLGTFSMTWILTWVMVVPLFAYSEALAYYLWSGFFVREVLLVALIHRASRNMGEPFEWWKTPLLDFNYAIYYLGTGLAALLSKRIRWKN
jgi:cellulose synthase/poly-beta-1,6-N-acetylglucosamine synthase-like glycosyltransferase